MYRTMYKLDEPGPVITKVEKKCSSVDSDVAHAKDVIQGLKDSTKADTFYIGATTQKPIERWDMGHYKQWTCMYLLLAGTAEQIQVREELVIRDYIGVDKSCCNRSPHASGYARDKLFAHLYVCVYGAKMGSMARGPTPRREEQKQLQQCQKRKIQMCNSENQMCNP